MTEEQKKYIKELRDKMLAEGASNDAIKFAINDYLYKESLKTSDLLLWKLLLRMTQKQMLFLLALI